MAWRNEAIRSITSSSAMIQLPWIKVTIGQYTFGVFSKKQENKKDDKDFFYTNCNVMYPNYIQDLSINKINGQVNQYTLNMSYPVRLTDDPNFLEKVFSSVSNTRKIVFSYGDMSMPSYIYKDEEAIITKVNTTFNLQSGVINYTVYATSTAILSTLENHTYKGGQIKPSDEIIRVLKKDEGLKKLFPGMNLANYRQLIAGDDKVVFVETKSNISSLDWIKYLVSCMIPEKFVRGDNANTDVYTLSMHDDTSYDELYTSNKDISGAYFTVERVSIGLNQSDALNIDIGFGQSDMIVTSFNLEDNENYSLMYDYATSKDNQYTERIDDNGMPYYAWAPQVSSKNSYHKTRAEDIVWYTKVTKYPVKANITIQGLLRSATLMNYVRLNVIFPGGKKHMSSGLYLVTKQLDTINSSSGYKTQLSLTRIDGDTID